MADEPNWEDLIIKSKSEYGLSPEEFKKHYLGTFQPKEHAMPNEDTPGGQLITVKFNLETLSLSLTALGREAETEGYEFGRTLMADDLSELHALADRMREILKRTSFPVGP